MKSTRPLSLLKKFSLLIPLTLATGTFASADLKAADGVGLGTELSSKGQYPWTPIWGTIDNHTYLLASEGSTLCLDVANLSTQVSAPLMQYYCHGGKNQRFVMVPSEGGLYELRSVNTGFCVDIMGKSFDNGALVTQYPCSNVSNQKFAIEALPDRTSRLVVEHSGQCLSIGGPDILAPNAPAIQQPCDGSKQQVWRLIPTGE
jgi:hypothetical protein